MASEMDSLAQPPACRSCCKHVTGSEANVPMFWESVEEYNEVSLAEGMKGLSGTTLSTAYANFSRKIRRAELGKLLFGRTDRFDVDRMVSTDSVLELKWNNVPPSVVGSGREELFARLYFTEPSIRDGLMLKLLLECKTKDGKESQNRAASSAQSRFDEWYRKEKPE